MGEKHVFHDVLTPTIQDWLGDFLAWEIVHPGLVDLERERDKALAKNDPDRQTADLCRWIAEMKATLAPLQPAARYLWNEARVLCDAWYEFVSHWRRLQAKAGFDHPVGPDGGKLRDVDRWAWGQLFEGRKGTE